MPDDTTLKTQVGPWSLENPVMTASGTFGHEDEMAAWLDLKVPGAVVLKTVTLHPRAGNPPPRIVETPGGILNSIGLPNEGLGHLLSVTRERMRGRCSALVANLAGERIGEFGEIARRVAEAEREDAAFDAVELNLSCPNLEGGGFSYAKVPELAERAVRQVREHLDLPILAKLSPNVSDIVPIAQACQAGGADALTLINTPLGMRLDWRTGQPLLGAQHGGFSGPGLKPFALYHVYNAYAATKMPIVGVGGIETAEDVMEFLAAGAAAVQVGTATFRRPRAIQEILEQLPRLLGACGLSSIREQIGRAHRHPREQSA
jgi:dihydroorotate dehydrogenase (NAD+) catalytic subunit